MMTSEMWPDRWLLDLFGIELPIVVAPMANFGGVDLAVAVAEAGGLGSLPCAALSPDLIRADAAAFRSRSNNPLHLNFFCQVVALPDHAKDRAWLARIAPYFAELGLAPPPLPLPAGHPPFGEADCAAVEDVRPDIVSFHFGLPPEPLLARGDRLQSRQRSDELARSAVACRAQCRCDHRSRRRGRWSSRHVPRD